MRCGSSSTSSGMLVGAGAGPRSIIAGIAAPVSSGSASASGVEQSAARQENVESLMLWKRESGAWVPGAAVPESDYQCV